MDPSLFIFAYGCPTKHQCWNGILSPLNCLYAFVKNQLSIHVWGVLGLYSVPLIYVPIFMSKPNRWDFPGSTVVKNLSANAGATGSIPGPGRSHMPWSN